MLALSYHFGFSTASAQVGSSGFAMTVSSGRVIVFTPSGDVYQRLLGGAGDIFDSSYPVSYVGKFWSGGATQTQHESWGQLKTRYAPKSGAPTSQPPTDR